MFTMGVLVVWGWISGDSWCWLRANDSTMGPMDTCMFTGRISRDTHKRVAATALAIVVFLFLLFRRASGVIYPMAVVAALVLAPTDHHPVLVVLDPHVAGGEEDLSPSRCSSDRSWASSIPMPSPTT